MEESSLGVSSFPLPPLQYAMHYTDENIAQNLAPPPPATPSGPYTMFGSSYDLTEPLIQSLESQGIRRLYPQACERKSEMHKINHSILTNFLDLLQILIASPNSPERERKLEDLELLFINMHHLINEYRPHQAYETLKLMMEMQQRERLEVKEKFHSLYESLETKLRNCLTQMSTSYGISTELSEKINSVQLTAELKANAAAKKTAKVDAKDSMLCKLLDSAS